MPTSDTNVILFLSNHFLENSLVFHPVLHSAGSLPLIYKWDHPATPAAALRLIAEEWPYPLLLESSLNRAGLGDYSFLTADPVSMQTVIKAEYGVDPFAAIRQQLQLYRSPHVCGFPPFQGGAAGLLCYELAHSWERLPQLPDSLGIPAATIGLYDWVLAWDHAAQECWLISQGFPETENFPRKILARSRAEQVQRVLKSDPVARQQAAAYVRPGAVSPVISNFTRPQYLTAVQRVIDYIKYGDIFQANLSQQLTCEIEISPLELYEALRSTNPGTFSGYFSTADWAVLSSSPERFLRVQDGTISTRPIKGTRQRRSAPEADLFTRDELRESRKDQAENVMIVDLLRNDLARVCLPESLRVPELCSVESYQTVTHLVSEVRGELRAGATFWDAIAAAFPGGSITGAPKVRAMEIIGELEQIARGPYCGSLFYCGFDSWADSSILIRTITAGRGRVTFPAGGGIVVGSDPLQEYQETLHKAAGMLLALGAQFNT